MTYADWITKCGSFNIAEKQALVKAFRSSGAAIVPKTAPTALTNNSGGTASDTIAAIGSSYTQSEVANAVASLAKKINDLRTALVSSGVLK